MLYITVHVEFVGTFQTPCDSPMSYLHLVEVEFLSIELEMDECQNEFLPIELQIYCLLQSTFPSVQNNIVVSRGYALWWSNSTTRDEKRCQVEAIFGATRE